MINIIAGMILLCSVRISEPGRYGSFIKDVETKVIYVNEKSGKKRLLLEFDFHKTPGIKYLGDYHDEKPTEMVALEDVVSPEYMNCKEKK